MRLLGKLGRLVPVLIALAVLAPAALALSVGCFDPSQPDGAVGCGADDSCPPDFSCDLVDRRCYRSPVNGVPDGDVPDAPVDGGGATADAIADASTVDAPPGSPDAAIDSGTSPECSDGIDNDCDGTLDVADPGCLSGADPSEQGAKACDDGIDNDGDGKIDFRAVGGCGLTDPQCTGPDDPKEDM